MYLIGVDPGLKGAIAVFKKDSESKLQLIGVRDMPIMPAIKGKGNTIDCTELARVFRAFDNNALCIIEAVSSMPGQGVASTFKFGKAAMAPEAMAYAFRMSVFFVSPNQWKTKAKLIKKPKEVALSLAKSLFPEHAGKHFRLKKHEGRAEAALIAYFGRMLMEQ
jgi:crossover junction endodeoxyribonuclease RuvC